jgi:hypothetical protein
MKQDISDSRCAKYESFYDVTEESSDSSRGEGVHVQKVGEGGGSVYVPTRD